MIETFYAIQILKPECTLDGGTNKNFSCVEMEIITILKIKIHSNTMIPKIAVKN